MRNYGSRYSHALRALGVGFDVGGSISLGAAGDAATSLLKQAEANGTTAALGAIKMMAKSDGSTAPVVDLSHPAAADLARTLTFHASGASPAKQTRDDIVSQVEAHAAAWASAPKVYLGPTNAGVVVAAASLALAYTPVVAFVPSFITINNGVAGDLLVTSLTVGADPSVFSGPIPGEVFGAQNYQSAAYFSGGPVSAAVPISLGTTNNGAGSLYVTAGIGGRRLDRLASGSCGA